MEPRPALGHEGQEEYLPFPHLHLSTDLPEGSLGGVRKGSTRTPLFRASSFPMAERQKQPKCPTADGWITKCSVHIQRSTTQP